MSVVGQSNSGCLGQAHTFLDEKGNERPTEDVFVQKHEAVTPGVTPTEPPVVKTEAEPPVVKTEAVVDIDVMMDPDFEKNLNALPTFQQQRDEFFSRVLALDGKSHFNIHTRFKPKDYRPGTKLPWSGEAALTLEEGVAAIERALKSDSTRDVFFCTSTQREAIDAETKFGRKFKKPIRNQKNVAQCKTLFVDFDPQKPDDTSEKKAQKYATLDEAKAALMEFCAATGFPLPNEAVESGGGLHCYWTFDTPISREEWQWRAHAFVELAGQRGLKIDAACTVDSARLLRVPGTLNYKYDPPRPVELAMAPEPDYPLAKLDAALTPYKGKTVSPPALSADGPDPEKFPPPPPDK
jgi:hypothetical protein